MPQSPHVQNGNDNSVSLKNAAGKIKRISVKCLEQGLVHRKPFIYFCIPVIVKAKADLFNEFNVGPRGGMWEPPVLPITETALRGTISESGAKA